MFDPLDSADLLQRLAPDFLETQQLIDFLVNRSGRTSLLVRKDAQVAQKLSLDVLDELCFTTELDPVEDADQPVGAKERFKSVRGDVVTLDDPLVGRMIRRMRSRAPEPLPLVDLVEAAGGKPPATGKIARLLLPLIAQGYVDPHLTIEESRVLSR